MNTDESRRRRRLASSRAPPPVSPVSWLPRLYVESYHTQGLLGGRTVPQNTARGAVKTKKLSISQAITRISFSCWGGFSSAWPSEMGLRNWICGRHNRSWGVIARGWYDILCFVGVDALIAPFVGVDALIAPFVGVDALIAPFVGVDALIAPFAAFRALCLIFLIVVVENSPNPL